MNNFQFFKGQTFTKRVRLILGVCCFILLNLSINAQSRFGVKASYEVHLSSPSYTDFSRDGIIYHNRINFLENTNGQAVGLFFNRQFNFLFLQGDLLYNQYNSLYMVEFLSETGMSPEYVEEQFKTLDIAITAGYRFKNFDIGVGPIIHKKLELESGLSQFDFYTDNSKSLTMGFQFAAAYNWGPFRLEAKLEDMFAKVGEHIGFSKGRRNKFDTAQSLFKLQLGIGF